MKLETLSGFTVIAIKYVVDECFIIVCRRCYSGLGLAWSMNILINRWYDFYLHLLFIYFVSDYIVSVGNLEVFISRKIFKMISYLNQKLCFLDECSVLLKSAMIWVENWCTTELKVLNEKVKSYPSITHWKKNVILTFRIWLRFTTRCGSRCNVCSLHYYLLYILIGAMCIYIGDYWEN